MKIARKSGNDGGMNAASIIKALGGPTKVAATVGSSRSAVSNWPKDGIPAKFWVPLLNAAEAANIEGVTLEALRQRPARSADGFRSRSSVPAQHRLAG